MDSRAEKILYAIIKEHIRSAAPVGSSMIVDKYKLNVSSATVRNVMVELEEDGFIIQPHTSAGRIPTEKAWHAYLASLNSKKSGKNHEFADILDEMNLSNVKDAARILAKNSGLAVFWAYSKQNLFYTGISNLLSQPEFSRLNSVSGISAIIDEVDVIVDDMFDRTILGIHALIGSENPFGAFCGSIIAKYKYGSQTGMFGIIGPMRMEYEKNLARARSIFEAVNR